MRRSWSLPLVLPVLTVLVATACSGSAPIDATPIIDPVTKKLNSFGVTVSGVDCPRDVAQAAGSTFTCTVTTSAGQKISVVVTQQDQGGQMKLNWEIGRDLVVTDRYLADLTAYAQEFSPDLTVGCDKAVVLEGGNGKLTCVVQDAKTHTGKLIVPVHDGAPVADHYQWSIDQS